MDGDEWETYDESAEPGSVRKASSNADLDQPEAQRRRIETNTWDDEFYGEGDDLMHSIAAITDDSGLDALLASYEDEAPQDVAEVPSADVSLAELIKSSLCEKRKTKAKPKKRAAEAETALVPANQPAVTCRTYHSKSGTRKQWTEEETKRLHIVLQQYGPNFSMLETFFPGRTPHEIKLKFQRDDKRNPGFLSDLMKNRRQIDIDLFAEWKQKSEQAKKDKTEKELDSMEMTINESELLAAWGDDLGLGLEDGATSDAAQPQQLAVDPKPSSDPKDVTSATAAEEDFGADEDDWGDMLEGYTDDLPTNYFGETGMDVPSMPQGDDGVEFYD